jgi:hypothetical protein
MAAPSDDLKQSKRFSGVFQALDSNFYINRRARLQTANFDSVKIFGQRGYRRSPELVCMLQQTACDNPQEWQGKV